MKFTFSFLFLFLSFYLLQAQVPFFNAWFTQDAERPFVKLQVSEGAVYELTMADLLAAGHNLSQANPDSIQVFYRGEEIPLVVNEDAQGAFASLHFYGRRNDGGVEASMYRNPFTGVPEARHQPNPNFSLYSDTSAYFLTWGTEAGLRYQTVFDNNYANYTPEASYPFELVWEPHPDSSASNNQQAIPSIGGGGAYDSFYQLNSDFGPGEGYISKNFFKVDTSWITTFLNTPQAISDSQDVRFQFRIFHRSNTEHHTRVSLANNAAVVILDTAISFNSVWMHTYERYLFTQVSAQTNLEFEAARRNTDNNHLTFIHIRYHREPDLAGTASTQISEWNRNFSTYFRFANAQGQNKVWVYDPENNMRYEGDIMQGDAHVILGGRFYGKSLELVTDQGYKKPLISQNHQLKNLCHPDSGANFIIIAHRSLANSAEAYAQYRDTTSASQEQLAAKVIYIDEIYEEFSYGSPTPQAIQQFVNCARNNWNTPLKYVFIWGKGSIWMREDSNKVLPVVPSYGYPGNDVRFTTPWGTDLTAQMPIGRLNIFEDQEGLDYLDKVKEFERTKAEDWRKKSLFLGGGATAGGQNAIANTIKKVQACLADSVLRDGKTYYFQKGRDSVEFYHDSINAGLGVIYFFGHASTNLNDVNLKESFEYSNDGKYPFLIMFGASTADFTGQETFADRWVKEPNKGCIAFVGNSGPGYLNPLRDYSNIFFCEQYPTNARKPIGEILRKTYQNMIDSLPGVQYKNHARQVSLQGDPSLIIFPFLWNAGINPPPSFELDIFPNPVADQLTISSLFNQIQAYRLFNLQGQEVMREVDLFTNKVVLEMFGLAPGAYFLQVETQQGLAIKKIVVK